MFQPHHASSCWTFDLVKILTLVNYMCGHEKQQYHLGGMCCCDGSSLVGCQKNLTCAFSLRCARVGMLDCPNVIGVGLFVVFD